MDHRSRDDASPHRRDPRHRLGAEGEERAARLLAERGYRIVGRNLRAGGVEIDLIATRGPVLAIVEVKTSAGGPDVETVAERLGGRQRARLARGAAAWLAEHGGRMRTREVRFDLVTCRSDGEGEWQLEHWPGAFEPGD